MEEALDLSFDRLLMMMILMYFLNLIKFLKYVNFIQEFCIKIHSTTLNSVLIYDIQTLVYTAVIVGPSYLLADIQCFPL